MKTQTVATLISVACAVAGCSTHSDPTYAGREDCPCPDFALRHDPVDPDSTGPCSAKSRTGQVIDAMEHPRCQQEIRDRQTPDPAGSETP